MEFTRQGFAACTILIAQMLLSQSAYADVANAAAAAADVQRAIDQGDAVRALALVAPALAAKPGDARLRFLQGVALFDLKRDAQALTVFAALAQDYPQLPEPHNNIAAIHARTGQWEQARAALELALRNDPSQTAARENLGDVYLQLALVQWSSAGSKTRPSQELQRKLRLARELLNLAP